MNPIYPGFAVVIIVLLVLNFVPLPVSVQVGLIFCDVVLASFLVVYLGFNGVE